MNNSDSNQSLTPPETEKVLALAARLSVEQKKQENLYSITELLSAAQAADIEEKYVHQALASLSPVKAESAGSVAPVDSDLPSKKDGLPVKLKFFEGSLTKTIAKAGFSLALASLAAFCTGQSLKGAFSPPHQNVSQAIKESLQNGSILDRLEDDLLQRVPDPNSNMLPIILVSIRLAFGVILLLACFELVSLGQLKKDNRSEMSRTLVLLIIAVYLIVLDALLSFSSPALIIAFFAGTVTFGETWVAYGCVERMYPTFRTLPWRKLFIGKIQSNKP